MASASVVKLEKVILDLQECVADLKSEFQESKIPIDDDCTTLHRFCAKLEYILQNGLKSKTNILGSKKDYWDYFRRALASETGGRGLHDGVKFVKCMPDLKTSLGKGRGFVRFCLMHRCLADTLQRCLINDKITCQWYESNSIMRQSEQWSELVTCLYELSEVQFDLSPRGQDLDVAWPTFARKLFGSQYSWQPPSRSISISSISSIVSQVDSSSTPEIDNLDCLRLQEEITELEASREELLHDLEELKSGEENSHKIAENAIAELEQVKVQSESKCKVLLDENLKLKEEIKMSLEKLRDIEQKNASQIAEAEKHAQEQQALIEELQSENSRFQARKQDETTMCQKMDALEIEKSQLECYIAELRAELSALRSSEANYKTKVEYYQQELSDLQTKNGELKSVMQRLHTIKEEKAAENIMICQRLGELSTQFTASQASLQELHKEKCFLQRKLETVESENTAAACTITSMSKELKELKKQVDALENENRHSQWQALEMEKDKINLQKEMTDLKSRLQKSIVSLAVNDESLEQVKKSLAELKDGFQGIASDRTEYHMDLVDKLCDLESYVFRLGDDVKLLSTSVLQEVSSSATRLSSLPEISPGHSGSPEISKNSGNETSSLKNSIVVVESLFQKQEAVIDNLLEKIEGFLKGSYHFNAHMNVLQKLLNVKFSSETSTCAVTLQSQIADLENALTFKVDSRYHGNTFGIVNTMSRIFSKLCELLKKNVRLQLELDFSHRMSSQLVDYIQENRKQISEATIDVAATENIVALLHKEHSKLKTAEEILKYELQQKRKLLTSLREQLFSSRKQWSRAQKMNSNALSEWKDLRTEFSQRDKQASEESGFVDDQSKNTDSDIPEEEIASSPEASSSSLVNLPSSDSKTKTDSLVEDDDSESVSEPEGATAPEPARSRLDILEEQCRLLYVSLLRSSERSAYLEQRLQALFSSDEEPASDLEMPSTSAEASEQENNDPTSEFSHASDDPISIDVSEPSSPESNTHLWDSNALLSGQHSSNTSNGTVVLQDIENMNRSSETPSEDSCTQSMQDDADEDKELSCLSDSNDEENRVGALRKQALDKIVMKLKDERIIHDGEVAKLKEELDQLQSANAHLEERLLAAEGEKERIAVRESEFRKRVDFIFKKERGCFDAQITELIDSKSALESKVSHLQNELDSRDQLVASLEASMQKLTDELSETKSDMTKEILAVKLQHNAETLKYEQSLKHYIEQEEEIALLKEQIHDQSNMIVSLENNLVELKESYAEEKEKHWQQLEEIKMTLSVRDEECSILNEELKKALKELDEEKKKHEILDEDYQKKLVQLKEYIAMLESKLTQVQADNVELKKQYVKLINDKDMLWKRTVQLCHLKNVKEAEKWVHDKDVTNCMECKTPFSLMLRRHHCRICGRIFCHACSDNWLSLSSNRRPSRTCNSCFEQHLKLETAVSEASSLTNISSIEVYEGGSMADDSSLIHEEGTTVLEDSVGLETSVASFIHSSDLPVTTLITVPSQTSMEDHAHKINTGEENVNHEKRMLTHIMRADPMDEAQDKFETTASERFDFYIITDEEITRSLSACSPYSTLISPDSKDVDGIQMIFTRTIEDIENEGSNGTLGEIWVNAGQQVGVPIIIEDMDLTIIWEFTSEPKSTSFSLIYRGTMSVEDTANVQILLGPTRVRSHEYVICGQLIARKPGLYVLIFDNQHSRFMAKKICYCLKVQRSASEANEEIMEDEE